VADIIKFKRGTAAEWTAANVILEDGEIGIETDTKNMKLGDGVTVWNSLDHTTKEIEDEITRVKTDISTSIMPTYAWRGNGVPTISGGPYKAYYIHSIVLKDSTQFIDIPSDAPDGATFSVENNDRTDYLTVRAPSGETINGSAAYQANYDTLNFFVKDGANWLLAYGGIFPNNLTALKTTIQALLPNSLNTIDEIQAQLKDRLHTFREIQNEFSDQLHTLEALEGDGFARASYRYGTLPDQTVPHDDNSWIKGEYPINEEKVIPFVNEGNKYLGFVIPSFLTPLISSLEINSTPMGFEDHDYLYNDLHYTILITDSTVVTGSNIRIKFEFASGTGSQSGIEIDDGTSDAASVVKINTNGMKITELPNQGGMASGEIELTSGVNIHMAAPNQQYGLALCNEIIVEPPLSVFDDPDSTNEFAARLEIKHDAYEQMHKPSFLAYLKETEDIVGKIQPDDQNTAKSHHDGALWFDDIVWPTGIYIQTDRVNKAYSIQEADQLDPNVSGGTDYLIAFRVHMKGVAPDDGFVRAYLYNKSIDPFEPTGYLTDKDGNLMVVQRNYKAGQELGYLDVLGIVNAKGLQSFSCHVVDNFANDIIEVTDRTEGCTGLMIQALTSEAKTGIGLLQFESDTQQNIEFSSHYLGVDRMNLAYILSRPEAPVSYTAGTNFISSNGWRLINPNGIKIGVVDGHLHIQDDGVHICDFNFGKAFSAEETLLLRGKDVEVTTTLVDKDDAFRVALMKWTGAPDEYTPEIFTTRNNGLPIFQTDWTKVEDFFISEDVVSGDHTVAHTFSVPTDANNYALIIYPEGAQLPIALKLKEFKADVNPAITGYVLHAPELANEQHLEFDTKYKEIAADNLGYGSFRYTINNVPDGMPMPIGKAIKGAADISFDRTINQVSGSENHAYEGAIKFDKDGNATISTELLVWSEKGSSVVAQTRFWWSRVSSDGLTFTKIDDSELTVGIRGGTKAINTMPTFSIKVDTGDRIALFATTDQSDGAYLQSVSPSAPMVSTTINFNELTADIVDHESKQLRDSELRVIPFTGISAQNYTFEIVISEFVSIGNCIVINTKTPNKRISVDGVEFSYDETSQELTVHIGSVTDGEIHLTLWR